MREKIALILLISIAVVAHWMWVFNDGIMTNSDWLFNYTQTSKEFLSFPQLWQVGALGGVGLTPSFYPFMLLQGILANIGVNYQFVERVLFMWPIVFGLPVFSYLLIKYIVKNSTAAFVGAVIYSFNSYFLVIQTGHLTLMMAYSLAPLAIYLYIKTLIEKDNISLILSSLALFLVSFYEFRAFYIICWVLFFYYIFYLLMNKTIENLKKLIKFSFLALTPPLIVLLLNYYWILGFIKTGTFFSNPVLNWGLFGGEFINIMHAITLHHPFWTGSLAAIFKVQSIPTYFWLIPVFAFLGLFLSRKNKIIVFFGLISILGIFLTKQEAYPFPYAYAWLYKNFPGFNVFRESSKFYFLIALGYSVLIAGFVKWVSENWINNKFQIFSKYILIFFIALIFLWNIKPLITREIRTLFISRYVPRDYIIANDFILKQDNFFRTLWIPVGSRWVVYTNNHPKINILEMIDLTWSNFVRNKIKNFPTQGELAVGVLSFSDANNLLSFSSIKYVFVPLEDKVNEDNLFINYGKPRKYYVNQLNKRSYLKKINIGTKEIVVYENSNYRPHIYITNNKESINKEQAYKTIDYKFINPTEYKFSVKNVLKPFYLNFSESYHPQWNLRIGSFNWFKVLTNKNYFISNKYHFQNDATLNSYLLDPKSICKQSATCKQNKDGSYDISGALYFKPQSYMYLGLIISGSTLAAVIGYLLFILGRNLYERKDR